MKRILFVIVIVTIHAFAITDVGGVIATNTVWGPTGNPPDTVYNVIGIVEVPDSVSLTIQPGVRIQSEYYGFLIFGRLTANGTEQDSILFTSNHSTPNPGDWLGISIYGTNDSSFFNYCSIEYAGDGIFGGPFIELRNSRIRYCNNGTFNVTRSTILDCFISTNTYCGIGIGYVDADSMRVTLGGNTISNNSVGIFYDSQRILPVFPSPNTFLANDTSILIWGGEIDITTTQEWNPAIGGTDCVLNGTILDIETTGALIISPGNSFKFHGGIMHVKGQLIASGTPDHQIIFTSANALPNPGDWYGIWFDAYCPDTSVFEHCCIEYGDEFSHAYGTPILIDNSIIRHLSSGMLTGGNVVIRDSEFSHNVEGIACWCEPDSFDIVISNCYLHNNQYGIHVFPPGGLPLFSMPSQFEDNDFDIYIVYDAVVRNDMTWQPAIDGVECYLDGSLIIDTTATFTIAPGNIFRMGINIEVYGKLIACGTEQSKITFTSRYPNPAPRDWGEIRFWAGAQTGTLEHCIVEYSDWSVGCYNDSMVIRNCTLRNSDRGVTFVTTSGVIENCLISNNEWFGILVTSLASDEGYRYKHSIIKDHEENLLRSDTAIISNNTISNNEQGIWCCFGGNPRVEYNEIYGNTEWGMYNEDNNYWIYAENNWWGDSTGPRDTSDIDTLYNPNGLGDRVSDHVDYYPWIGFTGCKEDSFAAPVVNNTVMHTPYPNPFFNAITFSYDVADEQHVKCLIYNALGQVVCVLCDTKQSAGYYRIIWNGKDNFGRALPIGVYWFRFETPSTKAIQKIVKIN